MVGRVGRRSEGSTITDSEHSRTAGPTAGRRAVWIGAVAFSVVVVALLGAAIAPAVGQGTTPPSVVVKFATIAKPTAVAATPGKLLVLSGSACSKVYAVSASGAVTTFALLATKVTKCPESALAISPGLGNFPAGEVFVLLSGKLYEIPASGSTSPVAAALTLANFTGGSMGLSFDYTGSFGFALLAIGGTRGSAVAIDAANEVRPIGSFGAVVEGPSVAPQAFGTSGGYLFAAQDSKTTVFAMSPAGAVTSFAKWGSTAEAVSFVPTLTCSYSTTGDSYFVADTSANALLAVPASAFHSVGGSGLVLGESRGVGAGLMDPNGSTHSFLSISGSLEGAAYVTCPVGVAKSVDLRSHGFGGTDLNIIGFDPATRQLIGTDPTGAPAQIFLLNGSTTAFEGNVSTGLGPAAVAYNPKTNVLFVANSGSDNLTVLNASTFQELGNISTGAGSHPVAVAFNPQNEKLYVTTPGNNSVVVFSLANNLFPNQNQRTRLNGTPSGVVIDPQDGNAYVVGNVNGSGTVWEFHAFKLTGTLTIGSDARTISVNNGTGTLYVTLAGSNELALVAPGDNLSTTVAIPHPVGAAFDTRTGVVFVVRADGNLSVVLGTSIIATYPFGGNPGSLVYDPVSDLVYGAADVTVFGLDPRIIIGGTGGG